MTSYIKNQHCDGTKPCFKTLELKFDILFIILFYNKMLYEIKELIEDAEDLMLLREAIKEDKNEPSISLSQLKNEL